MGIFAELVRPFAFSGLHTIAGRTDGDLRVWFGQSFYQVTQPIDVDHFVLSIHDPTPLMRAFAADINRMATAAIESLNEISREAHPPRACAWLIIQSYYSA